MRVLCAGEADSGPATSSQRDSGGKRRGSGPPEMDTEWNGSKDGGALLHLRFL